MTGDQNGWGEYSRLVLKELETLAKGIEALKVQMGDLKSEIAELKAKEDKVKELSAWKERIDEVASPTQLKEMQDTADTKMSVRYGSAGAQRGVRDKRALFFRTAGTEHV